MDEVPVLGVVDYETASEVSKPELRLWLRLLTCTAMMENEVRARLRREFEVTLPRFDLMAALDKAPDGLTMGELSRRLMVSNGNVTGVTERLVTEGLVTRLPSPTDRRTQYVKLTDAGRRTFRAMAKAHERWIAGMFDGLARDEMAELMALLGKAKHSVRASIDREEAR
ncbi:MAG TPA: MarR family transcriptional regulator [Alphaproteobacteria bacterium]|nr:MarR family transcriptional regulator [Alphaproteobacteria bacterium]